MATELAVHELKNEATRIAEEALYNQAGHDEEARNWGRAHLWLGLMTAVLSAGGGFTSIGGATANEKNQTMLSTIAAGIAFAVAALSGVSTQLDAKTQAANHNKAANAYRSLAFDARYLANVTCNNAAPFEALEKQIIEIKKKLDELDPATPMLTQKALAAAGLRIEAGEYQYEVDIARSQAPAEESSPAAPSPPSPPSPPSTNGETVARLVDGQPPAAATEASKSGG